MLIQVKFSSAPGGNRHTYNAPLTTVVGDQVKVPVETPYNGDGEAIATVVGIGTSPYEYAGDIKGIIEVLPREVEVTYTVHDPEKLREWGNELLADTARQSTRANVSGLLLTLARRAENERI